MNITATRIAAADVGYAPAHSPAAASVNRETGWNGQRQHPLNRIGWGKLFKGLSKA